MTNSPDRQPPPKILPGALSLSLPACYDSGMLLRLLRLMNRLGRLAARGTAWLGDYAAFWLDDALYGVRMRFSTPAGSERLEVGQPGEGQVSSLSGLVVILLLAVLIILLWSTTPQNEQAGGIIRLFAPGATPQPVAQADLPAEIANSGTPAPLAQPDGTVAFSMVVGAQQDLFALRAGDSSPVRLTDHPADDRDPAWGPDGRRLAFASHRDGNWELYVLDVVTGETVRLTHDLAFEAAPSWSPDGIWLAYEAYYGGQLDIYLIKSDGSEGPYPVTNSPAPEYSPAWTPDPAGRELAYVSLRDGNQDIFLLSLDDPSEAQAVNVTNTPSVDETTPAWSPDGGRLAYAAAESGTSLVYVADVSTIPVVPALVGQGHSPAWSPADGGLFFLSDRQANSLLMSGQINAWETSVEALALPAHAFSPVWTSANLPAQLPASLTSLAPMSPAPLVEEEIAAPAGLQEPRNLVNLGARGVITDSPYLSDQVDDSFRALREHVRQAAGWDFLARLDSVFWEDITRPSEPGQEYRNWHKAGRAFDIFQDYNLADPSQIELVPERIGPNLYWRLYVRCAVQDGSLGEPLRHHPWDFAARLGEDVEAYENGGRLKPSIPSGYYVDFTEIAALYGWQRIPSDSSWRYNWPGILYWQYEKRDGLDWWTAMLEVYSPETLEAAFSGPAPRATATPRPLPTSSAGQ